MERIDIMPYISGMVIDVIDGDTIKIRSCTSTYKVRLAGVDAPEKAQRYGRLAMHFLGSLLARKMVTAYVIGKDKYNRHIAYVRCGDQDVSACILRAGYAWHYGKYDDSVRYERLMLEARRAKRGLWQEPYASPPWRFRKRKPRGKSELIDLFAI